MSDSANALLWGQSKIVLVLAAVYLSIYALMYFSARRIGKLTATDSQSELERGVVSPRQDIASARPLPRASARGRFAFRTDSLCCFDQCYSVRLLWSRLREEIRCDSGGRGLEPHREYRSGHLYPTRLGRSLEPPSIASQ